MSLSVQETVFMSQYQHFNDNCESTSVTAAFSVKRKAYSKSTYHRKTRQLIEVRTSP